MGALLRALAVAASVIAVSACGAASQVAQTGAVAAPPAHRADPKPPHTANLAAPTPPTARPLVGVRVRRTAYGRALTDRRGFALYLFTSDRSTVSTCYGACATAWPPYIVRRRPTAAPGADAALLGVTRRRDGRLQLTYAGHPLYYYVGDRQPGVVLCQAVTEYGGGWYVVAPSGTAIQ
jgi:predicted lipoprotein with Yx(FWY)xxD motif